MNQAAEQEAPALSAQRGAKTQNQQDDSQKIYHEQFRLFQEITEQVNNKSLSIPPCPETALRLQQAVECGDKDAAQLAEIIYTEPLLVARILDYANGPMTRASATEVTNIKTAITRVGAQAIRSIAIALAMEQSFPLGEGSHLGRMAQRLREESVIASLLGVMLAQNADYRGNKDQLMLAALIHGIGKYYLLSRANDYPTLFQDQASVDELIHQWYPSIGAIITESWDLPADIVSAIDHLNTEIDTEAKSISFDAILASAVAMTRAFLDDELSWENFADSNAVAALGLDEQSFENIVELTNTSAPDLLAAS